MGVSTNLTTRKWSPCSSPNVPLTSFKRREGCITNTTFPNIMMSSSFPRFYSSFNNARRFPIKKYAYRLSVGASSAKMVPFCQDLNSFEGNYSSKGTFDLPKIDEKREKLNGKQFLEFASYYRPNPSIFSNETFSAKNTIHSSRGWMTETTRLHVMKEVESCQTNTESLRDEKEDAKAQDRKRAAISTVINILESKHNRSFTSSKTECLQDSSFYSPITSSKQQHYFQKFNQQKKPIIKGLADLRNGAVGGHPKNHPGSVMAVTKQVTGSEEKSEDFVNDQIPLDKKTNMECLRYEKEVAEYQERKGATVLTVPNLSDFRNSEIECFEDGSSYSPPPKLVGSKRSNQKNPKNDAAEGTGQNKKALENENSEKIEILRSKLASFYSNVMVVDNVSAAKKVVWMLTNKYKHLVHACDTEVAKIDVKQETPVDHGKVICFSIYSGPEADFGNGKSCIWVDLLDGGGRDILNEFAPFFEDPSIKKVWHNYSFDNHVLENYGLKVSGFHADTMHMARLWDSSRRTEGGYSLEALTGDRKVMSEDKKAYQKDMSKDNTDEGFMGKISMKDIFGRRKLKKDGSAGKISTIAPVEELQREERELWISYSAFDSINTLKLYKSLKKKLLEMSWKLDGKPVPGKSMFDFYQEYWQPFGEILVKMETEGMLVDREYLSEIEKVARAEQEAAVNRFRKWASKHCPDAKYMNVGSDTQLRQLLFGGKPNSKDDSESLPTERIFKVPNTEGVIAEGKKTPSKFRNITLRSIGVDLPTEIYTATGWPSVGGDALKTLARNISAEYDCVDGAHDLDDSGCTEETEYKGAVASNNKIFATEQEAREACDAISALCEVCSIDSLISNFILPLQGSNVSGKNGRVHCSLNINTETGRLSARRPNLQNQPALEKDRYKIRQAFIAAPGNSLIVADYGQLELRILAHLANCKSMLDAFKAGGDFHSRTAMNMYQHIRNAVETGQVLLEWHGEDKPPVPLLKVSVEEAKKTVDLWYNERQEVLTWQEARKKESRIDNHVHTLLGRARRFPAIKSLTRSQRNHIERAAINTPVQGSAADVAMCAMLEISKNARLKELGWKLLLQVHDEVILEGPSESAEVARAIVVECMSKPFNGKNNLRVDLSVDAKCAQNWYSAK
ncbi:DNA polymerase I A, chloroplastic/mitochondrial isoform X2 [Citrus clementina]|uniref:DNA polymerase I A, chloroplastic/mitochondrial isoform X2 n=1 Tax=Citrus clementina TaxID=85681 RepID=UPI000CED1C41|nr:DNA polymerase I A, chloroplastic/mitochondrial isoform X2 [Citrus x clementina]